MIAALLIASAPIVSAIDAELAFARDARRLGQWSAFRKWADDDAVMFTPKAAWAKTVLKSLKDSPSSISWTPARTYSSCDGRTAVNIGPWFTQDHRLAGYFTTVWQRTRGEWRWTYDGGLPIAEGSRAARRMSERASCALPSEKAVKPLPASEDWRPPRKLDDAGGGYSADRSLGWAWKVTAEGERRLRVYLWNGGRYVDVINATDPSRQTQ